MVAYIPPPPLISSSYPYSVLATMSLLFLAFQAAFLAVPQKHMRCNTNKLLSLLSIRWCPFPIQTHLPDAHHHHIKYVPCQNCFALPFIPTVKLCTGLPLPIHHPVHLFVTLLYNHSLCLSPTELMPDMHVSFKDTFKALWQAMTKMGLSPSYKALLTN